jgi:hypothetical protein
MWPTRTRPATVRTTSWLSLAAIAVAGALGCGGAGGKATAHLQGTVTLDGKPLPADASAHVQFVPTGKDKDPAPPASAPVINGRYDAPTVPVGAVRVIFNITQPSGPEFVNDRGGTERASISLVPEKYGSGIDLTVTGDNAAQDFDL